MYNVENSNYLGLKAFKSVRSKKILVFTAPGLNDDGGKYEENVILDSWDKSRVMSIMGINNQFSLELINLSDGFGTVNQTIEEFNKLQYGIIALGYEVIYIGTAFINEGILHIEWR